MLPMSKTKTRKRTELRPVKIEKFPTQAAGSVLIKQGNTHVLCTASIAAELPRWMAPKRGEEPTKGWVSAEYNMLPASTNDRKRRGPDSRGTEIQRLIGRVLRAAVDMDKVPGLAITCDCDVLQADGGTRTASITGAYVALVQAINHARKEGMIKTNPIIGNVAAVSVGVIDGLPTLDLDYPLDVRAEVDMNVAMNNKGQFIEVQGTGEQGTFSRDELNSLLDLATKGIRQLIRTQNAFLKK